MLFDTVARIDCVDDYPTSPLNACSKDGDRIEALFVDVGGWPCGAFRKRFNDQVTCKSITQDMKKHIEEINCGIRRSIFVKSGHGTELPDRQNKKQGRSQLYCPYDIDMSWDSPHLPTDYDYEKAFAGITCPGKHGVFMFCCNSGGMFNTYIDDANRAAAKHAGISPRIKYLRGPWEHLYAQERMKACAKPKVFQRVSDAVFEDPDSNYYYWAATRSDMYSYEINSPMYGHGDTSALFLCHIVRKNPAITIRKAHKEVCEAIQDVYGFEQIPQLWGPKRLLDSDFFS